MKVRSAILIIYVITYSLANLYDYAEEIFSQNFCKQLGSVYNKFKNVN